MNSASDQRGSLNFLAGGGEMGARIRSFDWASTALGPPESWPQSLKTSIRIMLMSRQPVWIGWGDELVYFYNDPYFSIIGGKHPWALGRPTREVWHEIWDVISPMLATAMGGDEGTFVESQRLIMERNGYPEETYYTFSYSPIPDDDGEPGGIFCANSEDTQRVIGQRELALLRDLAARTAKSKTVDEVIERSIAALESNPWDIPFAAIYLVSEGEIHAHLRRSTRIDEGHPLTPHAIDLNDAFFRFGDAVDGQTPQILDIHEFSSLLPVGPWQHPSSKALVLPLPSAGETSRGGVLLCGLSPYRLVNEGYSGFMNLVAGQIAAALSDAEASERDRKRMDAMAELDRAKTAFFANVSHEFRTPLTLILGPLQDLISQDLAILPSRVQLELETIYKNGLRLQKLVNTLLDFSRLEAGRLRAKFCRTDIGTFTAELASAFNSSMRRAQLEFIVDCPELPTEEQAYVDRDLWEKVVLNLMSNAFKHTFEGSIRISLRQSSDSFDLTVADTGIGIAPQNLDHLFDRFHRVEGARARSHEGSGIGLALVHEIVKLHGGEIAVSSQTTGPARGTTFRVSIPIGHAHLPLEQVVESPWPGAWAQDADEIRMVSSWVDGGPDRLDAPADGQPMLPVRSRGATVLIADDNADMRSYISRLLGPGFGLELVADGQAALDSISASIPDLVITDVMMPRLDGFGLVKAIRSDPKISEIPIILLSARAGEESKIEGLDAGADDYLVKPFSARELLARVDSTLTLARLRKEVQESLRQSEHRLQLALLAAEAEKVRLRDLFTRAPALITVLKGPKHVFELANPGFLSAIGRRDEQELLGKPFEDVLPEIAEQGLIEVLDRVYETGEPYFGVERRFRFPGDGNGAVDDRYFDFVYQPSRDLTGQVDGILVHAVDVTNQVRARRSIEHLASELEYKVKERTVELTLANEQLQGFAYSVAHDLRQQIRRISTNASMILHDEADRLNLDARGKLQRMVSGAQQLSELVDDLLSYTKNSIAMVQPESVDLSRVAEEISESLLETGPYRGLVKMNVQPTPIAAVDRSMARVILENLIENAFKYSCNVESPGVEFGFDKGAYYVRDNGVGFDMRFVHKLFLPFERLHSDPSISGTGIGLANVQRLIDKHKGKIWAEGNPGKGSTFWFTLSQASAPEPVPAGVAGGGELL